jgi:hypothetical protein
VGNSLGAVPPPRIFSHHPRNLRPVRHSLHRR